MKTLRVLGLFLAAMLVWAGTASAQDIHVTGNTSFTVMWEGMTSEDDPVLASARVTISNFTNASFLLTVDNVVNQTPLSPDINARLTAFGFSLTPEVDTFGAPVNGSIYDWAFTHFPGFQRVDVCLTAGSGCGGGAAGGLNQGQSTPETMSITAAGNFTNGVTFDPIAAKFDTTAGSYAFVGTVIDPPPPGASDLTIAKRHVQASFAPGQTVTYALTVTNVGTSASSGLVTVTETPPTGLTITAISGTGWNCTAPMGPCTRSDALAPAASYPAISVTATVAANATAGTITNVATVAGGGDPNTNNNAAADPTVITVDPTDPTDPTPTNATPVPVPALPLPFVIGLMLVLLATALYHLRSRRITAV